MIRDTDTIPYRQTQAYAKAAAQAAIQNAQMHHRVGTLWPSQHGQSTSGIMRRNPGALSRWASARSQDAGDRHGPVPGRGNRRSIAKDTRRRRAGAQGAA